MVADWRRLLTLSKKRILIAIVALASLCLVGEFFRVTVGRNLHTVIPGKIYRSAQPTASGLEESVRRYNIKTVLNLRGTGPMSQWYQEESQATFDLDLCQEDLNLSAGRLPSSTELQRLIEILDYAEYPMLVHCRRGADRTGLVSAIIMLLEDGVSYSEGRSYLGMRFGHISIGRTALMAEFFDFYKDYLNEHGKEHSPAVFRQWILHGYRGGHCNCRFMECELPPQPIALGKPFDVKLTLKNTGSRSWHFKRMPTAGVHVKMIVFDKQGNEVSHGLAGYLEKTVQPGKSIELVMPVHGIAKPGRYLMVFDMYDEQMGAFFQMGSEPHEARIIVGE